ncbi:hypothetical protein HC891_19520, partial [Candidatus Gracilibacteria bacterium]|nr:hypothetical protein [Candidatus Gracilibacteria bacterium]
MSYRRPDGGSARSSSDRGYNGSAFGTISGWVIAALIAGAIMVIGFIIGGATGAAGAYLAQSPAHGLP